MIVTSARANYQSRQRPASAGEAYEVCLRSDERGADLISDALPFGRPWYGEPNAPIDFSKVSVQASQIAKQLVRRLALRPISPMFVSLITQRTLCPQPRQSRVSIGVVSGILQKNHNASKDRSPRFAICCALLGLPTSRFRALHLHRVSSWRNNCTAKRNEGTSAGCNNGYVSHREDGIQNVGCE